MGNGGIRSKDPIMGGLNIDLRCQIFDYEIMRKKERVHISDIYHLCKVHHSGFQKNNVKIFLTGFLIGYKFSRKIFYIKLVKIKQFF